MPSTAPATHPSPSPLPNHTLRIHQQPPTPPDLEHPSSPLLHPHPKPHLKSKTHSQLHSTTSINHIPAHEDLQMSPQQQFYYLRLMAKPGKKPEPIKMKFVRWTTGAEQGGSVDDEGQLESQAMRVVRTIGQAFEVCHKVTQEQMQEKLAEEETSSIIRGKAKRVSASAISEEDLDAMQEEERQQGISGPSQTPTAVAPTSVSAGSIAGSRASTPAQPPPAGMPKRHSIYVPRKLSSDVSSQGTAIEMAAAATAAAAATSQYPQPTPPITSNSNQSGINMPSGSNTLPHSQTWNPHHHTGPAAYPSVQSLDVQTTTAAYPFYSLPGIVPPSASMPYGLSSPGMVSPYATLQLPAVIPNTQQVPQISPGNASLATDTALQLTRTLDQYNQQLFRSQLDQAQQSAQVASCQVQLLRDQLTSETTARIEAQSKTHQLLNTNRDLLEQVQALVSRLQNLETKLTQQIHNPTSSDLNSRSQPLSVFQQPISPNQQPIPQHDYITINPCTSVSVAYADQPQLNSRTTSFALVEPQRPYQIQTLADLRSGSLPPVTDENSENSFKKKKRNPDDSGAKTEPETEDTTDYSSSDQYEHTNTSKSKNTEFNLLLSNPQIIQNLSSFFHSNPSTSNASFNPLITSIPPTSMPKYPQQAGNDSINAPKQHQPVYHQHSHPKLGFNSTPPNKSNDMQPSSSGSPQRQTSPKRTLRRFSLQSQRLLDDDTGTPPRGKKPKASGVFKEKEFTRLSFNTPLSRAVAKRESIVDSTTDPQSHIHEEGTARRKSKDEASATPNQRRKSTAFPKQTTNLLGGRPQTDSAAFKAGTSKGGFNLMGMRQAASSSLATAMYPPIKRSHVQSSIPSRRTIAPLTTDLEQHDEYHQSGSSTSIQTLLAPLRKVTELGTLLAQNTSVIHRPTKSIDPQNVINNNGGLVTLPNRSPDPDSVKGRSQQGLESQKFDSNILARLMKRDPEDNVPNGVP